MNLLAIDTSTSNCSVAVQAGDRVETLGQTGPTLHAEVLLGQITQALSAVSLTPAELDCVVCGRGPGSFTGLRVGVGVAQGLAYSANAPVLGLCSLTGFLDDEMEGEHIGTAIDARMGQLYYAAYEIRQGVPVKIIEPGVNDPGNIPAELADCSRLLGAGWWQYRNKLADAFTKKLDPDMANQLPRAVNLLGWGKQALQSGIQTIPAQELEPLYVRNKVAEVPK